jgi:hypothetical protein
MILGSASNFSSHARARRLGEATAVSLQPPIPVSQVDGLNKLWQVANSEEASGENKMRRILARMELAAVRPRAKREGEGPGWWSNAYPDLIFS